MAIKPEQLDEQIQRNNIAFLSSLETKIDKALQHAYNQCNPSKVTVRVGYDEYFRLDTKLYQRLKDMYLGWNLRKFTKDDYEGTDYYLELSDPRK